MEKKRKGIHALGPNSLLEAELHSPPGPLAPLCCLSPGVNDRWGPRLGLIARDRLPLGPLLARSERQPALGRFGARKRH